MEIESPRGLVHERSQKQIRQYACPQLKESPKWALLLPFETTRKDYPQNQTHLLEVISKCKWHPIAAVTVGVPPHADRHRPDACLSRQNNTMVFKCVYPKL